MPQAVEDAVNAGIDRFSFDDRDNVKRSQKELRIPEDLAKEILDTVARKAFIQFISRSRSQRDRLEAAKELKRMVFFSNIVVAPLLEDTQVGLGENAWLSADRGRWEGGDICMLLKGKGGGGICMGLLSYWFDPERSPQCRNAFALFPGIVEFRLTLF